MLDEIKAPWYIDLLNINLNNHDLQTAQDRIRKYMSSFKKDGTRITENLDTADDSSPNEVEMFDHEIDETKQWMQSPRFAGITRLYSPRQVVEQRGTIAQDYPVARSASEGMFARLRELFAAKQAITTFGPYSPGQAVVMKRVGIEGIYLGGWATSAKGSVNRGPGF